MHTHAHTHTHTHTHTHLITQVHINRAFAVFYHLRSAYTRKEISNLSEIYIHTTTKKAKSAAERESMPVL